MIKLSKKEYLRDYYIKNKEVISQKNRLYYLKNKKHSLEKQKEYISKNIDKLKEYKHQWYLDNIDLCKERAKISESKKDKKKEIIRKNTWKKNNRDKANKQMRSRYNIRKEYDINYKLCYTLRNRLNKAIKNNQKKGSAVKNLGCTIDELKIYLESKFQEGMSWDNWSYTGWHIDHIIPISSFNLQNKSELIKAIHYTNLQPLWAKENMLKSNKII